MKIMLNSETNTPATGSVYTIAVTPAIINRFFYPIQGMVNHRNPSQTQSTCDLFEPAWTPAISAFLRTWAIVQGIRWNAKYGEKTLSMGDRNEKSHFHSSPNI